MNTAKLTIFFDW